MGTIHACDLGRIGGLLWQDPLMEAAHRLGVPTHTSAGPEPGSLSGQLWATGRVIASKSPTKPSPELFTTTVKPGGAQWTR